MVLIEWLSKFVSTDLGKILGGAVIALLGIAFTQFLSWWKDRAADAKKRERSARYLALRLVLQLDDFSGLCFGAAMNNEPEINPSDPMDFRFRTETPTLNLPENADWQMLEPKLADDVLWLENNLRNVRSAHSSLDVTPDDYDDLFEHRALDYSKLGLSTLEIIEKLCKRYDIKRPERPTYYKPEEGFRSKLAKMEAFFEVKEEHNRAAWEQHRIQVAEFNERKKQELIRVFAPASADVVKTPGGDDGLAH